MQNNNFEIKPKKIKFADLTEGQSFSFQDTITVSDIDSFAHFSGDLNPIHMSEQFAILSGFSGRIAHGVLVSSLISRLIGMYLPGKYSIILGMNVKFVAPVYANNQLEVLGIISSLSMSTSVAILKITVRSPDLKFKYIIGDVTVKLTS